MAWPHRRIVWNDRQEPLEATPFDPRVLVALRAADLADEQDVTGEQQLVHRFVQGDVVVAVPRNVIRSQLQLADGQRCAVHERNGRVHARVRSEWSSGQFNRAIVAVCVVRMAMRIDDVRDGEALRTGPLDEDIGRI